MSYIEVTTWLIDHLGFEGYFKLKGLILVLSGFVIGSIVMIFYSAFVMKNVKPNPELEKVTLLVVGKDLYTSPPKTIFEAFEKRFFIFMYKIGLFRKTIGFHNKKLMRTIFVIHVSIISLVTVLALYAAFTLAITIDGDASNKSEKVYMYHLKKAHQIEEELQKKD